MPTASEFQESAASLYRFSRRYHRFQKDPQSFLDYIHDLEPDDLQDYLDWAEQFLTKTIEGVQQISPVVFLRRIIVERILEGKRVSRSDLKEIQKHIDGRNLEYFSDYPHLHDEIANQKERARSAFHSWDTFKILFMIDYYFHSREVKEWLKTIADFLQDGLGLSKCDYHTAGFDHNQNFGTDWCWVALYPSSAKDHKDAHQVFFSVRPDRYTYGIASGSRIDSDYRDEESLPADEEIDMARLLEAYREKLPRFHSLNQDLVSSAETSPRRRQLVRSQHPLNLILYGPPGTGKTYSVQQRAVEIVEGTSKELSAKETSLRFRDYLDDGRIEFTTFHPSYSYEEFVEGFRYDPDQKIPLLQDGVLKQIVDRAINPYRKSRAKDGARIWKVSLGDPESRDIYDRCIENGEIAIGWWSDVDFTGMDRKAIQGVFEERGQGNKTNSINCVDYFINGIQEGDYVGVLNDQKTIRAIGVVDGPYEYRGNSYARYPHVRPVKWLDQRVHNIYELNGRKNIGMPTLYPLDRISLRDFVELLPDHKEEERPYVLIIDEINRGNLSRIFGELITLLEPDKRKGAENELTVRLPYSQEQFTLPPNLYVIGTMNTADRSIALLDVALRRRFEFEEMMPEVKVIQNQLAAALEEDEEMELSAEQVELIKGVFEKMNRRITVLLDRDHQVGHSYFLRVRSMSDVHHVWYRRVLPLVQEYFYNDQERLTLLLGQYQPGEKKGFVKSLKDDYGNLFDGRAATNESTPWSFHQYQVGDLEDALERTFELG